MKPDYWICGFVDDWEGAQQPAQESNNPFIQ